MKKLLACLLVLACLGTAALASDVLLIAPNPNSAEASWTDGTDTVKGTLDEVMQQVNEKGGTVTLLKDIEMNDGKKGYVIYSDKSFTLDLNGHTIYSVSRLCGRRGSHVRKTQLQCGSRRHRAEKRHFLGAYAAEYCVL